MGTSCDDANERKNKRISAFVYPMLLISIRLTQRFDRNAYIRVFKACVMPETDNWTNITAIEIIVVGRLLDQLSICDGEVPNCICIFLYIYVFISQPVVGRLELF